jgi:hypothetical protein
MLALSAHGNKKNIILIADDFPDLAVEQLLGIGGA